MENLKFRRQFLLTAKECKEINHWNREQLGSYVIYAHPDCEFSVFEEGNGTKVVLVGYFFDPNLPNQDETKILQNISSADTLEEITELIYPLVGRFVLFIQSLETYIFHDACGLKSVFFTVYDSGFYAASQPNLLKLVVPIEEGSNYRKYYESDYVKTHKEHYIPTGISLYESVQQLIPNHYINLNEGRQRRFWPTKELTTLELDSADRKITHILLETMRIAASRFSLAVPLTAGLDSRILLSACKDIKDELKFYTLKYRKLDNKSADLRIPIQMAASHNLDYEVLDCVQEPDPEFLKIYSDNSDMAHIDDWGFIANGMYKTFNPKLTTLKGNCIEIGRCVYFKNGKHPEKLTVTDLLDRQYYWDQLDFVVDGLKKWLDEISDENINKGYQVWDLFYWEHRVGGWQSQSQLEWDIVQEAFTPFNNRELIDLMLRVDKEHRIKPELTLFTNLITQLWPELLIHQINPKSRTRKVLNFVKKPFTNMDIYDKLVKMIKRS